MIDKDCDLCKDFLRFNYQLLHHPSMKVEITCSECGKIFAGGCEERAKRGMI